MPTYDYRCDANGQVVEVRHRMSEEVKNWGELCELAGMETGETPVDSPVSRLATGGQVVRSSSLKDSTPPCGVGGAGGCGGGMCGLN
ncbi:MAG: zinc ribbon domain-containing protein [Gammaproteobacteria bacterium]|nr:zinc ribbon domain-containing protein [Gammaproteobacteria bacterium]